MILSDEEVRNLRHRLSEGHNTFARRIEAAVLAKLDAGQGEEVKEAQRKLPDYFKALELPWHLAAPIMGQFVDDDERSIGYPTHHARPLFTIASVLAAALRRSEAGRMGAEAEKSRLEEALSEKADAGNSMRWYFEAKKAESLAAALQERLTALQAQLQAEREKVVRLREAVESCLARGKPCGYDSGDSRIVEICEKALAAQKGGKS